MFFLLFGGGVGGGPVGPTYEFVSFEHETLMPALLFASERIRPAVTFDSETIRPALEFSSETLEPE